MENKYTGEIPFSYGAISGVMVFNYAAMAVVKSNITQQEMDNLAQLNPEKLSLIAAAGFMKKNPEITKEMIMEASPPIMALAEAIDRGMLFAFHGPEGARKILEPLDEANKKAEELLAEESKKNEENQSTATT